MTESNTTIKKQFGDLDQITQAPSSYNAVIFDGKVKEYQINIIDLINSIGTRKITNLEVINSPSDFPDPTQDKIFLSDNTAYLVGNVEIQMGANSIVAGENSSIIGIGINAALTFSDGGVLEISDKNFQISNIRLNNLKLEATNIDYTINPSVDFAQGRNKSLTLQNLDLDGDININNGDLGFIEGFERVIFDDIRANNAGFQYGLKISNILSVKYSKLSFNTWDNLVGALFVLRDNNWSNQPNNTTGYTPLGSGRSVANSCGFSIDGVGKYIVKVEEGFSGEGTFTNNDFAISNGAEFLQPSTQADPTQDVNDLTDFSFVNNRGIADNVATLNGVFEQYAAGVTPVDTTFSAQNTPTSFNFDNRAEITSSQFISQRLLVQTVTAGGNPIFFVGDVVEEYAGAVSTGKTAKIRSVDTVNNYLYVDSIKDSQGNFTKFTANNSLQTSTATTNYLGVDGAVKYSGGKAITFKIFQDIAIQKNSNGNNVDYEIGLYKNDILIQGALKQITLSVGEVATVNYAIAVEVIQGDIIEPKISVAGATSNSIALTSFSELYF